MEPHMFKRLMCALLLMSGVIAQVKAEQGCPYPSAVKYADQHFHAVDKGLLWQSPKVSHRDFVDRFVGAVFVPGEDQERENGYMDKCIYRTSWGSVVALRPDKGNGVINMSLTSTLHWALQAGAFGMPVYLCTDSQPDNCAFTINDKER